MVTLILNTGVQFVQLDGEYTIDLNANVMKAIRLFEFQFNDKVFLEPVCYFPTKDKYLRRNDLLMGGYLDPITNEMAPEEVINPNMNWLDVDQLLSVSRLDIPIGSKRVSGLTLLENKWIPIPYYQKDMTGASVSPTNWCRMKLIPIEEKCTQRKRVYKIVLVFDTKEGVGTFGEEGPEVNGKPFEHYAFCGISRDDLQSLEEEQRKICDDFTIPLKVYDYCDMSQREWLNEYLQEIFDSKDFLKQPEGSMMKYLAYYMYFVCYIHKMNILPDIKLYSDKELPSINTNIVIDVGNSRTYGLVAEDPLNLSFSKADILELHDLSTGDAYPEAFDMRLCFKDENFGLSVGEDRFRWPSIVRLGKEALNIIYDAGQDLRANEEFDTNHSSPKRYLWDKKPYSGQWKFVSEKDRFVGPSNTVFMEGITQQFRSDGSFTPDPKEMGDKSSYSRSSLMTFCFVEILLQARMQINSVKFREKNGDQARKREISRVIITCPTAMPKQEQITMRKAMEEATVVVKRCLGGTYNMTYEPDSDREKVEIIPSVRDLSRSAEDADTRRTWSFDEATCCQMVYMYSELRRYLGNTKEFFNLYGKRRNGEAKNSLTVASLDIGAGTTDIMICNYKDLGESIRPEPLFWETFHLAGDDLVNRIIKDVILEPQIDYPEDSGVVARRLKAVGCPDIADKMHHFFSDTQRQGVIDRRMRKEFNIQVLMPVAYLLLDKLQKNDEDCMLKYEDIFGSRKPSDDLMDFFADQFGFRFEELEIPFSKSFLNETVCRVFERPLRKWASLFYSFKCDVVLLAGRPCSIDQMYRLVKRLTPVAPNRLISMNKYRVGSWYVGATDAGRFSEDKKSLVAVGALISYLAEQGKLPMFKLTTDSLKIKIQPTTEYIGTMNVDTGKLEPFITPEENVSDVEISALPVFIGSKQMDVMGYPSKMLYRLDFDEDVLRRKAVENQIQAMGLAPDTPEATIPADFIQNDIETQKFRAKSKVPLRFRFERDYFNDKEKIAIESVENADHDTLPAKMFTLELQSRAEDESNWLDSGVFGLHINL